MLSGWPHRRTYGVTNHFDATRNNALRRPTTSCLRNRKPRLNVALLAPLKRQTQLFVSRLLTAADPLNRKQHEGETGVCPCFTVSDLSDKIRCETGKGIGGRRAL